METNYQFKTFTRSSVLSFMDKCIGFKLSSQPMWNIWIHLLLNVKKKKIAAIFSLKVTPMSETLACLLFHLISLCHLNGSDLSGHLRVSAVPGTRKLAIDALDPVWCLCCVHDSVTSHESTAELGSGQVGG